MARMFGWAVLGAFIGFLVYNVAFLATGDFTRREFGLLIVLSTLGAFPAAILATLFAAVSIIQAELRETRREMKHWQSTFQMLDDEDGPSTHFKPGLPP